MPYIIDQDRGPCLHRGEVPDKRSHDPLLRHFQAVPEQGPVFAPDGLSDLQGALQHRRGYHHVTSIIMKDTAAESDVLPRANAIRALCRIIDGSTVQGIERLIKTAIVDKTPSVSSAALVSSYHLLPIARDVVRRWQSETQEAASSSKPSTGSWASPPAQAQIPRPTP